MPEFVTRTTESHQPSGNVIIVKRIRLVNQKRTRTYTLPNSERSYKRISAEFNGGTKLRANSDFYPQKLGGVAKLGDLISMMSNIGTSI